MSNNAAVTVDGGEIGRAQALQARAARVEPTVHMNPSCSSPRRPTGAQVIVQGRRAATLTAPRLTSRSAASYLPAILDSFQRARAANADLIIVEGAGSPAEINLRDGDLANMGFAAAADIPASSSATFIAAASSPRSSAPSRSSIAAMRSAKGS